MAPRSASVQSVGRALDLLEALADPSDSGLLELAQRAGLQPSTAHRLLSTLVARRYAIQEPGGRYRLGDKLGELAAIVAERTGPLRALARPHLEAIQRVTRETASLTILEPPRLVYVDQVEGSRSMRMFARLGATVPAHATAGGKAMLAHLDAEVVAGMLADEPLEPLTPHTITSLDALADELARVRARGYAFDREEQEAGVGCVGAAILDGNDPVGALSVSAPLTRIEATGPDDLGELLTTRASAISAELAARR
jgi:IclR family acetate operon transcriptional repressor